MPIFKDASRIAPVRTPNCDPFSFIDSFIDIDGSETKQRIEVDPASDGLHIAVCEQASALLLVREELKHDAIKTTYDQIPLAAEHCNMVEEKVMAWEPFDISAKTKSIDHDAPQKQISFHGYPRVCPEPEPDPSPACHKPIVVRNQFTVAIDKTNQAKLGIHLCRADDKTLIVASIVGGLVNDWNKNQPPHLHVQVGDAIASVNGKLVPLMEREKILLNSQGKISFDIRPHFRFTVSIWRGEGESDKLGLDVSNKPYDHTLRVTRVLPGLVSDWAYLHPDNAVRPNDRICEINGAEGPGQLLRKWLNETRGQIVLSMIRSEQ